MTAIPSLTAFHRHLDTCPRCRCQPFNLCAVGHALLTGAVNEDTAVVPPVAVVPPLMEGVE